MTRSAAEARRNGFCWNGLATPASSPAEKSLAASCAPHSRPVCDLLIEIRERNRMELSNGLPTRKGERGAARAKLLVFLVFAGVMIYAGYLYLPVAYDAYLFKDLMQHN